MTAVIILLYGLQTIAYNQDTDLREVFLAAESYYLFEEFNEALPLYLRIHRVYPDNDNINYKIGVCLLNNPYEKDKSIQYLEKAVKNINPKFRENNFKETKAPLESHFYLGHAYRINNQFDKARASYRKFLDLLDPEVYDADLVKEQIAACDAAESLMKKPLDMNMDILPEEINTRFSDINPAISGDENHLVFVSKLQFYDAVFYSRKENGRWSPPRNIVPELGVDGDVYPTCLSHDGTEMIVYRNDQFIGNLYSSRLVGGKWTPLVKLNDNINTKFWESSGSLSKDGKTLYFSSNRKGGFGGLDLYKSERTSGGDWGVPVNLGPTLNTKYNDDAPYVTEDGDKLFFISYGHYNMGGYDVFMSRKAADGNWANPLNLGYPVNSSDDDQYFVPYRNGEVAYHAKYTEGGFGRHDIYRYEIFSPDNPRRFPVTGLIEYMGQNPDSALVDITVKDRSTGTTLLVTHPDRQGIYQFSLPAGKYDVLFDAEKFHQQMLKLDILPNTPHSGIRLPGQVRMEPLPAPPTQDELNKKLILTDSLFNLTKPGPVNIEFEAEKGATVVVNVYRDSILVSSDTMIVDRKRQSYELIPQPGNSKVEIILTDDNGNRVVKNAEVNFNPPPPPPPPVEEVVTEKPNIIQSIFTPSAKEPYNPSLSGTASLLSDFADGNLKLLLQSLDLREEGIGDISELIDYLYSNSDKYGYLTDDVNRMFIKALAFKDLQSFISDLERVSEGNLKKTLQSLNPAENGITSPRELVDYLIKESANLKYQSEDVIASLGILASRESGSTAYLMKAIASDCENTLIDYLEKLDTLSLKIDSPEKLAVHLYKESLTGRFSTDDYLTVLTDLAASKDPNTIRNQLIPKTSGDLRALLDTLNLEANEIFTAQALLDFLYRNPYRLNYTDQDVSKAITSLLYDNSGRIADFRQQLIALSDGKLKEFLMKNNPEFLKIQSEEEFLAYLRKMAESQGYSEEDINRILLKMSYDGDLQNLIGKMSEFSGGNLKLTLENLDAEEEGIGNISELISWLTKNAGKNDYSQKDVYEMIGDYIATGDMELFRRQVMKTAGPELRSYLGTLNLKDLGIKTRQELAVHLLNSDKTTQLSREEVIGLMLSADEASFAVLLPYINTLAGEDLKHLISEIPADIPVSEAYIQLLEKTSKRPELRAEINDIFSKYLGNLDVQLFYRKLVENASGNLINSLASLSTSLHGIADTGWLVEELIKRGPEYGYTTDEVIELLAKTIAREDLKTFIEKMALYASPGLLQALKEIDLKAQGIETVEQLIAYLRSVAGKYGFSENEIWKIIEKLAISEYLEDYKPEEKSVQVEEKLFNHRALQAAGVLALLGFIVFIMIIFSRKKKRKENAKE